MAQGPYWRPSQAVLKRPPIPIQDKTNAELAQKFSEWLVAQRYLKVAQLIRSAANERDKAVIELLYATGVELQSL